MTEKPPLPKQVAAAEQDRRVRAALAEQDKRDLAEVRRRLARDCDTCRATLALADELCKAHKHIRHPDDLYDDWYPPPRRPRTPRSTNPVDRVKRQLGWD